MSGQPLEKIEKPPYLLAKVSRVVFLCFKTSMTYQVDKCQQCQNEHPKSHQVLKVKVFIAFIFPAHLHHISHWTFT